MATATSSWWPKLRAHISGEAHDQLPVKGVCSNRAPICGNTLSICGIPAPADVDTQPCVVLPCGHVMCEPCIVDMDGGLIERKCPNCETSLACRNCDVAAICPKAPTQTEPTTQVPPVKPDGAPYNNLCMECTAAEEWMAELKGGRLPVELGDLRTNLAVHQAYDAMHSLELHNNAWDKATVEEKVKEDRVRDAMVHGYHLSDAELERDLLTDAEFEVVCQVRDTFIANSMAKQCQADYHWFPVNGDELDSHCFADKVEEPDSHCFADKVEEVDS